jgi:hypothetical protein
MHTYNTGQKPLILKEYGRNIHNLVNFLLTIEDIEKRTQQAYTLVEVMKMVTPSVKDYPEYEQKLWDDIYIMSRFQLDLNGPYPKPEPTIVFRKPQRVPYPQENIRFKHYGKGIQRLVLKATELEEPEERESAIIHIGRLMKTFYLTWNKDNIDDKVIIANIKELSKGALEIDLEKVREFNLFDSSIKERNHEREARESRPDHRHRGPKNRKGGKQNRRRN